MSAFLTRCPASGTQEELDSLAGKTLLEGEVGYMVSSYGSGSEEDEVVIADIRTAMAAFVYYESLISRMCAACRTSSGQGRLR